MRSESRILALGGEFRQSLFRGFDLPLKADDPIEPRAGVHAGVGGLAREVLVELPEAPPLRRPTPGRDPGVDAPLWSRASAATASASFGSVPMRRMLSRTAVSMA